MSLELLSQLGKGGTGMQGQEAASAFAALRELQGLTFSLLTGAAGGTKIDLAAIRQEDNIVAAINNNAGTLTDVKADTTIVDVRASGTVTLASAVAGNTVTVNGRLYTAVAGVPANYTQFSIDTDDTAAAASLAAAINTREENYDYKVIASADAGVVTITAVAEGTSGNALTLAKVGAPITVSGATLSGGTATGGIKVTGATNQVILVWFNKR